METMVLCMIFIATIFCLTLAYLLFNHSEAKNIGKRLPGCSSRPIFGEILEFYGDPERFVKKRIDKYGSCIFQAKLFWKPSAVLCSPAGNKFLFSNENKLVQVWWPASIQKLFPTSIINTSGDKARLTRRLLMTYLSPETLQRYVGFMDAAAGRHMQAEWEGKSEVKAFPLVKIFTFYLACSLFMGVEDPDQLSRLVAEFKVMLKGVVSLPLNFPGTRFYRSLRAAAAIKEEIRSLIQKKGIASSEEGKMRRVVSSPECRAQDLLSHLMFTIDEKGQVMREREIIDNILVLLFAAHDTSTSTIAMLLKYLAEMPHIYDQVSNEQLEISKSKTSGESLDWTDIKNMKYSWNVVSEVMRISPPIPGAFREVIKDFVYEGYSISKGWKLYWSVHSTHMKPEYFPEPEKFDPGRFEGEGPAPYTFNPFGGGPRMCPGKEYAKIQILVFLHNMVKRFRWEKVSMHEKIEVDPMPSPSQGLPLRLYPRCA